jgi:SAM-dependent methyltransferase
MKSSGLAGFLRSARQRSLDRHSLANDPVNIYFSGTTFTLWRAAVAATRAHSKGLVLDAGSGRGGWRSVIESNGANREALDITERPGVDLDWIGDLTAIPDVPSERFDNVVCHQVLEHVPRPQAAIGELARVLRSGGGLVLSVPHLSRLHEMPHDYFRYTGAGLRVLIEDAGLEIVEISPYGGIMSFLHHQFSTLFLGFATVTGPLYPMFVLLNAPLTVLSAALDWLIDRSNLAPNGYVAVARKTSSHGEK